MINKDEFELLNVFVTCEIESIDRQLVWYRNHDPKNIEHVSSRETYAKRLKILRNKINDVVEKGEAQ